uniref:BTB domain-containing protein n=1 Tax=Daphnia galeata TaxID=27404 RepID=A0A8J2WK38_9CRUS|nr:unnamed protein product [Daphnia galeata]
MNDNQFDKIINLNVGGKQFSTSGQTLTWIPDTFFTSLLSGTLVDDRGPIFIERYSTLFTHVLNYLHTKEIHLTEAIGMRGLCMKLSSMESLHSQQLKLVQELEHSSCSNELYYGCLNPPSVPFPDVTNEDGEANLVGDGLQQNCYNLL